MDSREFAGLALTLGVPAVVGIGIVVGLDTIRAARLARTDWSLADAPSEERRSRRSDRTERRSATTRRRRFRSPSRRRARAG